MLKFNTVIKIFLLAVLLLSWSNFSLAGFGVSPPGIIEDRLVGGSRLERIVYLVQGDPKVDMDMEIIVDSPQITDWISFETGTAFTIPAGVQQFPLKVIIDVPKDTDLGVYKAFIRVNTKPKPAEGVDGGAGVSIALGGRIDVDLTVGDDIFSDFEIKRIQILDIKEGDYLKIALRIENTGNVSVSPERVSFELFNKYGDVRLAYVESSDIPEIKSFTTKEIVIELPIDIKLGIGEYWGTVKVYKDGNVASKTRTVFNVLAKTFWEKYWVWMVGIGIFALIIATLAVFGFRFIKKGFRN